jgi:hypothetical protein
MRDCPSKRVMVIRDDGEYSSASDFDDDTLALLATDRVGSEQHPEEHIDAGDAERYSVCLALKWRRRSKTSGTSYFRQGV